MNTKVKRSIAAVSIFAVLVVLGSAGESDYNEAVKQNERYCAMMKAGIWPENKSKNCEENNYVRR